MIHHYNYINNNKKTQLFLLKFWNNLLNLLAEILRINLIDLLEDILKKSHKDFLPVIPELCSMLAKFLTDQCPEVKIKLSELLTHISSVLGKNMGPNTKGICNSLCQNLKHSHNKIRKITLQVFILKFFMNFRSFKFIKLLKRL